MHAPLLLALVIALIAVPGAGASLALFARDNLPLVTRLATVFGLGYTAAAGVAFLLARVGALSTGWYAVSWVAVSALVWFAAVRRTPVRRLAGAWTAVDRADRLPLLLGAAVVVTIVAWHVGYLHVLGGPRYVYYLDGVQIANAHGVPSGTLQYGQSWPPATDKILMDCFSAVLVVLHAGVALAPGVLLWMATLGAAIGLWATCWELGLRWTGSLAPLLLLANTRVFDTAMTADFGEYRHEDFARAVAFCGVALAIRAVRGRRRDAAVAGVILAAASGSHLIAAVAAAVLLVSFGIAQLLADRTRQGVVTTLAQGGIIAAVTGVLGLAIRVFAGGDFGLQGASNPATYRRVSPFDPTAYLQTGRFVPPGKPPGSHWYTPPWQLVRDTLGTATGTSLGTTAVWLLAVAAVTAAVLVFAFCAYPLRLVGLVAVGYVAGLLAVELYFDRRYGIYVDATFGVRRLRDYAALGVVLALLGVAEALLVLIGRVRPVPLGRVRLRLSTGVAVLAVVAVTAWVVPVSGPTPWMRKSGDLRMQFASWVRTETPCNARFLVNQRTEGFFEALTGRYAITEGMGPFLRVERLPHVVDLFLEARGFFQHPAAHEGLLRRYDISYVVVGGTLRVGYRGGPLGRANIRRLDQAPFLQRVLTRKSVIVYAVLGGSPPPPPSALLRGPYRHCFTTPLRF